MRHAHKYFIYLMFVLLIAFGLMLSAGQSNAAVKTFGIGNIGDSFVEILVDDSLGTPMGTPMGSLMFYDYLNHKTVFGLVTLVAAESSSKVNFSGTYTTADGANSTFQASAEDLGTGDSIDKFSITLSDGYAKSAVLDCGEIEIITN